MDKWQAIQAFWESFNLPAYDENTVPDNAAMPYITYEAKTADFGKPLALSAQLFARTSSWKDICIKSDEIAAYIGNGSKILPVTGGYICIQQGSPFAQRMREDSNGDIRRIIINIMVEFFTAT